MLVFEAPPLLLAALRLGAAFLASGWKRGFIGSLNFVKLLKNSMNEPCLGYAYLQEIKNVDAKQLAAGCRHRVASR
ncbi:MAG: hypothetical protein V7L27_10370 [Nostoc sp.]|uniref:hypothetical protein n=1 Tax=Nostoc sp. TaxID=1180 RepID=UPI002FF6B688